MFLKAKITGYVALRKSFARFDVPVEHERAASAPLFAKNTKKVPFYPTKG